MARIGIVGAGSWGTALSHVLSDNGHELAVWSPDVNEIEMLSTKHMQTDKLPGVELDPTILYSTDISKVVPDKEVIVVAVPSPFVRSTAERMKPYVNDQQIIVTVAKGIEDETYKTMSQIIEDVLPANATAALSGPSHAEEVGRRMPTTVVAAAASKELAEYVQSLFMNDYFRVYTSPDVLGVELGGALKNVIALAAGISDGLGFGDNGKAALMTRGIHEISNMALSLGAKDVTLSGLSGIGDLIVTCTSVHSRNRKAGYLMGQGMSMKDAMEEVHQVVEGVYAAKAAYHLSRRCGVEMPIVEQINQVLFEDKDPRTAVGELMHRDRKAEDAGLTW
ncbi:MAG: NAD(P)H-dependent glycerol-3-phosphate dehydrogenase [Lachnospiraceae bacterium]|nr:NAD(P)H-dependent glycerol-3-phosphate dehydrogenase [Candidatus Equihabitans merdae]